MIDFLNNLNGTPLQLVAIVSYAVQVLGLCIGLAVVVTYRRLFHNPHLWKVFVVVLILLLLRRADDLSELFGFDLINPFMTLITSTVLTVAFIVMLAMAIRIARHTDQIESQERQLEADKLTLAD